MAEEAQKVLLESVKGFLTTGDHSDLTITCQSDSYKVHKVVVCSRSKFFENAVKFPGKESESNTVDLPEDEPEMVKLLIQYLYEGEYEPRFLPRTSPVQTNGRRVAAHTCTQRRSYCDEGRVCAHHYCGSQCSYDCLNFVCPECSPPLDGKASQLSTHATMYAIGEQYGVVGLKELSQEKFRLACLIFWDQPEFSIAAHIVFSTTVEEDKGLRDIVSQTISGHIELVKKPEIEVLMTDFNGLAFGILKQKVLKGW